MDQTIMGPMKRLGTSRFQLKTDAESVVQRRRQLQYRGQGGNGGHSCAYPDRPYPVGDGMDAGNRTMPGHWAGGMGGSAQNIEVNAATPS